MGVGDTAAFAVKVGNLAKEAHTKHPPGIERDFCLLEAEFWRRSKEPEKEKAARLTAALTYIVESEMQISTGHSSYMAASGLLIKGIDAIRQANGDPKVIADLRKKLRTYQSAALNELSLIKFPKVDISEQAQAAQKFVEADTLIEALRQMAFGHPITNVQEFREYVLKLADTTPIMFLMTNGLMDSQGRTEAKVDGLLMKQGVEFEKSLESHMFQQAARGDWRFRAATFIEPARVKIWYDHRPTHRDLEFLVTCNPFIPPGHEQIFLLGLFYGLAGDLILSSHLLAPQIENSLRYVLERHGVDVSNINADLTQPVKVLGPLFDLPQTLEIFGPDMCFELRGHLIEKSGFAFRNQVAHGFVSDNACYSDAGLGVWWLTLRLCFHGLLFLEGLEENTPSETSESFNE
ncbi:hypothetical protein BGE01nite_48020 [Brevifollis gellanilyticus]|uniref:DUF4209 domain-containing protein n=2 Tax=Brevifollis gellanilyticus TaxID=748831 RepID=A0A512MGN8_9BACT|nr:hypothetical protein BGE01nite_48020 [Brevifollis gellanilyticus]